jgi:hypothetical protein
MFESIASTVGERRDGRELTAGNAVSGRKCPLDRRPKRVCVWLEKLPHRKIAFLTEIRSTYRSDGPIELVQDLAHWHRTYLTDGLIGMLIGEMVSRYASILGSAEATVSKVAQLLRKDGLLSTGARGVNAPRMSTLDGARLLIALLATDRPASSPSAVRTFGQIPGLKWEKIIESREQSANFETVLAVLLDHLKDLGTETLTVVQARSRSMTIVPSSLRAELELPWGYGDVRFTFEHGEAERWEFLLNPENFDALASHAHAPAKSNPEAPSKGVAFSAVGAKIEVQRAITFATFCQIGRLFADPCHQEEAA